MIMKVTVVGSHLCPDTIYALNMSASLPDLKVYLKLRDEEPMYEKVKAGGGIGIPCFILEDGTKTMDLKDVLK